MRALGGRRPAAPHPRRGLPWRASPMVALDFETTGLDLHHDHVIAYGAIPIEDGHVRVGAGRSQLIHPPAPPSERSQTIHLLREVDLVDAPETREAAAGLRAALANRFLVTWYADVEIAFLRRLFGGEHAGGIHAWKLADGEAGFTAAALPTHRLWTRRAPKPMLAWRAKTKSG